MYCKKRSAKNCKIKKNNVILRPEKNNNENENE